MEIVEIVSRDPNHANRLFDSNGAEYSHPLGMEIFELPFKGVVNSTRNMVIGIVLFNGSIIVQGFNNTKEIGELVAW
jgi:hypothetical protein